MQAEVFVPLGMAATTFDYRRALSGIHASAHTADIDGQPARAGFDLNYSIVPCARQVAPGVARTTC